MAIEAVKSACGMAGAIAVLKMYPKAQPAMAP
jgi:hypothetical protein